MLQRMSIRIPVITLLAGLLISTIVSAAPTAEQRREIAGFRGKLQQAGKLYQQGKFQESGKSLENIQKQVMNLAAGGDKQVIRLLDPIYSSLKRARGALQKKGIKLPPLGKLGEKPKNAPQPAEPLELPPKGEVSFVKHMAPILVSKCGRCHVSAARGMMSMANFDDLMKGTEAGAVVLKGDADGSRLVEVIQSGDMPRGGIKVTDAELTTIQMWIKQGAKYDGESKQTSLARLAPNVRPSRAPRVEVAKSTGKETVHFSSDIAPILSEHCANCHGRGRRPSGRFNLNTFAAMLRGGESGPPILPGKPADSLLIKKLKGTGGGQRMPLRKPALPDATIAMIEKWIAEGATFDGPDANQVVEQVAALAKAKASSHEELSADRAKRSGQTWRLAMPGLDADRAETANFLLLGNVGEKTLQGYAELAESLTPKVAAILDAPSDRALVKGRLTLYFFRQRYDYSEFGNMIEKRQLPREWKGHWRYNVVEAYGTVLPSRNDEYTVDALLAQHLAGVYVSSLTTTPPRWFSEGSARVAAAKIAPQDGRVQQWDQEVAASLKAMTKADDFMTGKLPQETADVASYGFVKYLLSDTNRFQQLLSALGRGSEFGKAFTDAYGSTPSELASRWAARAAAEKPAGKKPRSALRG